MTYSAIHFGTATQVPILGRSAPRAGGGGDAQSCPLHGGRGSGTFNQKTWEFNRISWGLMGFN